MPEYAASRCWPVVVCLTLLLALANAMGCAGVGTRSGDRPGIGESNSVGAVDEAFRRAGGSDGNDVFRPIDRPTPNDQRLASGVPGPGYWQQRCDYRIEARLDPVTETVSASMTISYHNNSPHSLPYIWMNLDQNLFNTASIGTRTRTPGSVMKMLEDDFDGGFAVPTIRSHGQDLAMKVYDTLGRIDLPEALAPGQTLELEIDFGFRIPPHLRRMGAEKVEQGTIFEIAQWFPQVSKYDDVHGWNTLPYLGTGEFYTDFGDYEVSITVPRDYIVAASGELVNPGEVLTAVQLGRLNAARDSDEPVWIIRGDEVGTAGNRPEVGDEFTWQFRAKDTRTFAWAASDAFLWDACAARITDREGNDRVVLCQSLYPREAKAWSPDDKGGGSSRYAKHSIEFYSDFLFPYPYPVMSNINGPEGGMEYPGIVFCGARTSARGLFGVTDHEIGHNWFPMVINSDERRYMWQDEGFNTFINMYSKAAWYEKDVDITRAARQTMWMSMADNAEPIMTEPDRVWPRWVGGLMYRKTGYGLWLLREYILGPERFDLAWQGYMDAWYFKSPQPADFFRAMENGAGADLSWFWRGWFMEPYTLDQSIAGVRQLDSDSAIVVLDNLGEMVMPVRMRIEYKGGESEVVDLPVDIWTQTSRWRAGVGTAGRKIKSVTLDPDGILPDTDRENNTWK